MYSAASVKRGDKPRNRIPREGTRVRRLYDLFMVRKGLPVSTAEMVKALANPKHENVAVRIEYLIDFCGLDIRHLKRGSWILTGLIRDDGTVEDFLTTGGLT